MDEGQKKSQRLESILNIAAAVATIIASILTIAVVLSSAPASDNQGDSSSEVSCQTKGGPPTRMPF